MGTEREASGDESRDRLATAVGLYALGEVSLGKAASMAGRSRWEMKEILERNDVPLRVGPQSDADLEEEIENALDLE